MSRLRTLHLGLLLCAAWVPVGASAEQVAPPDAGPQEAEPNSGAKLESERKLLLPFTPVRKMGPACTSSTECAEKLGYGNVCLEGHCQGYEDETDLFTLFHLSKPGQVAPQPYQLLPAILPAVGYNPALGFLIGATAFLGIYLGDPETTTISNAQPTFLYTSKNQVVIQMTSTIMTSENEWELQGDYRLLFYNQDTYGLGSGVTPVSGGFTISGYGQTAPVPGAQPMDFDLLRFHQSVLKKVVGPLYLGLAARFDRYFGINDELLDLSANPPVVTSSYAYSRYYGFNSTQYNIVSLGIEALYDSRDSTINPYRGYYANFVFRGNPTWLGSSQDSTQLYGEFRTYLGLDDAVPRNVLAFWFLAQGVTTGALPYMALPAIGWDARGRTGRGYVAGRFRGTAEVYAESELRFRLTDDGFLGAVVFANASTFSRPAVKITGYSNPGEPLFQNIRPAGGVGLRFMMNRASRTNVTVDFSFSQTGFGVYLGAGEAF
jgi:Omp85 superfamily domain